jgi:hypothetical protein
MNINIAMHEWVMAILSKFVRAVQAVNNIQNYWVFRLFLSFGILENREHGVSETGSVSVLSKL